MSAYILQIDHGRFDKFLIHQDPNYYEKKNKTIYLPIGNIIEEHGEHRLCPIRFLSKRPKLYSLFNRANYQHKELNYVGDEMLTEYAQHFARILLTLDVWDCCHIWYPLDSARAGLKNTLEQGFPGSLLETSSGISDSIKTEDLREFIRASDIRSFWRNLAGMGDLFEELIRIRDVPVYSWSCGQSGH